MPIDNAPEELVEMDFVDYGDYPAFLRIRDTFSRFSVIALTGGWVVVVVGGEEKSAEMVRESAISNWLSVFGETEIIVVDKDLAIIGSGFSRIFENPVTSRYRP